MKEKATVWVYSPGYLKGPGLLMSAASAGAIGIIDLGETSFEQWGHLSHNLLQLQNYYPMSAPIGFRVAPEYVQALMDLPEFPKQHEIFVVLAGVTFPEELKIIQEFPNCSFYSEVYSSATITTIETYCEKTSIKLSGYVAVAAEAGGRTGDSSAFLLLQELQRKTTLPIYLRGGIGIHVAGTLRLGNIAGLVLDDQVLLFPGSPLSEFQKDMICHLEGRETEIIQIQESNYSIISQPWAQAAQNILSSYKEMEKDNSPDKRKALENYLKEQLFWGDSKTSIWPIGQMLGMAKVYQKRYSTLQRFIHALHKAYCSTIESVAQHNSTSSEALLSIDHQTEFPVVQGPMTRVSDSSDFALEVSHAGGLPFIALGLLKDDKLNKLLTETANVLGDKNWGVGILGFVPPDLREEQIVEILRVKPPFAIIAGGRTDQADILEKEGIRTYLHVPSPILLRSFIRDGSKRFIFEGRECGGHVGPFYSFPLWEQMITVLLEEVPENQSDDYSVLFAGGIHDALSSAIVSVLSSQLASKGIKTGVLMGTAYLSCYETVRTGAISQAFQNEVIACSQTTLLVSGIGHANRCVSSPFSEEFKKKRIALLQEGLHQNEISAILDKLLLGRLRIASKGLKHTEDGSYINISDNQVVEEGMFMAGDVATLLAEKRSMRDLHLDVTENAIDLIRSSVQPTLVKEEAIHAAVDIAIIGISLMVPGSNRVDEFWETILNKTNHLKEIPSDRWDWKILFDEDVKKEDKIYSRWGGFIEDVLFDPLKYGLPPKSVPNIATGQLLALEGVNWALEDASLTTDMMDRENTSVIFATTDSGGFLGNSLVVRSYLPFFSECGMENVQNRTQGWTEDTFSGILGNVIPGRIANRFDFGGRNYAVDAACASSLLAVDLGVRELTSKRSNLAIVGGIDIGQTPFGYMAFSKTGALSPSGKSMPFDKSANGIVISEGGSVVIMKRLTDAQKDGNKIYAVIKGIAGSSDGKGMGLTAPRSEGQQLSVSRAYAEAGFKPDTIRLYEGHGTGTKVGDIEELNTIINCLRQSSVPHSVALGSIKSLIGHTKMAAGLVSLAKTALSLYYKVLPPHPILNPLDAALEEDSPVYFLKEAIPWLKHPTHPRRAGVSAFGFGGANFHAVLEEHEGYESSLKNGGDKWPVELLVFGADSEEALIGELQKLVGQIPNPVEFDLKDLAWTLAKKYTVKDWACRLAIVVAEPIQLPSILENAIKATKGQKNDSHNSNIFYNLHSKKNKIAFLFSGQGSQYLNMGREMALYFPEFRENLERAERILADAYPTRFSNFLFPEGAFDTKSLEQQKQALNNTHVAQLAIGIISTAFLDVFTRLGISSDCMAGHSFGELTALHAAGVYNRDDFFRFSEFRGRVMAKAGKNDGTMAVAIATRDDVEQFIETTKLNVVIANHNGPSQVVISGAVGEIEKAKKGLAAIGKDCFGLNVSAAFHSPMMADARKPIEDFIKNVSFEKPKVPVFSNLTGKPYTVNPDTIRKMLPDHLTQPVEFVTQIKEMYSDEGQIFVELGPRRVLTGMVQKILQGNSYLALSAENSESGLHDFLALIGELWVAGTNVKLDQLFRNRDVNTLTLNNLAEYTQSVPQKSTSWLINGHLAKPVNASFYSDLPQPILNFENRTKLIGNMKAEYQQKKEKTASAPQQFASSANNNTATGFPQENNPTIAVYQAYQETMRQFLRTQEQIMKVFLGDKNEQELKSPEHSTVKNIPPISQMTVNVPVNPAPFGKDAFVPGSNNILDNPILDSKPEVPSNLESNPVSNHVAVPGSKEEIKDILVELISEKTGYPEDMIEIDLDLEADLGIDSIKRVEIFQRFIERLPKDKTSDLVSNIDSFLRIKKLKDLVERMAAALESEQNEVKSATHNLT